MYINAIVLYTIEPQPVTVYLNEVEIDTDMPLDNGPNLISIFNEYIQAVRDGKVTAVRKFSDYHVHMHDEKCLSAEDDWENDPGDNYKVTCADGWDTYHIQQWLWDNYESHLIKEIEYLGAE